MKFNKCVRCGCFFASSDDVCPSCKSKDEVDKHTLKNYLDNADSPLSLDSLSFNSGVELKNINRYMESKEFSNYKKMLGGDGFDNVKLYKPTLNGDTLSLQAEGDPIQNFDDELNGLIWYKTHISHDGDQFRNEFSYMDKKVTFWNGDETTPKEHEFWVYDDGSDETDGGNQIKSVAVTEDKMVVLRYSDDDTVIVYEGNPNENEEIKLTQIGIIYEDLPSVTQSIIIGNELIFVKYNGSSNSSDLYVVDLDNIEETRRSHETSIAGLNAEAFFTIKNNLNDVYMLTKDKGVFKISDTTVTPVPDLRRI